MEAGALSVSVEDADEGTEQEKPLFGEPGMEPAEAAWDHSRVVALTEGEGAHLGNGRGGEDDTQDGRGMCQFSGDPTSAVRYEHYFDGGGQILTGTTLFPQSAAIFRTLFGG